MTDKPMTVEERAESIMSALLRHIGSDDGTDPIGNGIIRKALDTHAAQARREALEESAEEALSNMTNHRWEDGIRGYSARDAYLRGFAEASEKIEAAIRALMDKKEGERMERGERGTNCCMGYGPCVAVDTGKPCLKCGFPLEAKR